MAELTSSCLRRPRHRWVAEAAPLRHGSSKTYLRAGSESGAQAAAVKGPWGVPPFAACGYKAWGAPPLTDQGARGCRSPSCARVGGREGSGSAAGGCAAPRRCPRV